MGGKLRVLMVFSDWQRRPDESYGGCGYVRIYQPGVWLKKLYPDEIEVDVAGRITDGNEIWTDLWARLWTKYELIVVHNPGNFEAVMQMVASRDFMLSKGYNRKIVFDYDDYYFAIDRFSPCYSNYNPKSGKLEQIAFIMRQADALTVTTPKLQELYRRLNSNVFLLPNCADTEYWVRDFERKENDDEIRLGWWGSVTHYSDLKEIIDVLREIVEKYPKVRFVCVGQPADYFGILPKERFEFHEGELVFEKWVRKARDLRLDIAIAPLKKSVFNSCKSPVKFFEYSALGIAGVYAGDKSLPYCGVVEHGKTGFLASNAKDWLKYLSRLIEDKDLRKTIAENAYEAVRTKFHIKNYAWRWLNAYRAIMMGGANYDFVGSLQ